MSLDPKPGLVIRYDFLWKEEEQAGRQDGQKDRPCAVVLASAEKPDGSRDVMLCAITHSPPGQGETAIEVPPKVARHIGLDDDRSWIKTDQVNLLRWEQGRIPYGVSQARSGEWAFGQVPQALGKQVFDQVRENAREKSLQTVRRDEDKTTERATRHARQTNRDRSKIRDNERER